MQHLRSLVLKAAAILAVAVPLTAQSFKVNNLLSDGSVPAAVTDPNFLNPWAISASPTFWISAADTGFNYVVPPTTGTPAFKVIVPTAAAPNTAPGLPAGSVTTAGTVGFNLTNGTKASFIFSTLDGTISGWNSKLGTNNAISTIMVNNSASGASYPGLAILNVATNNVTSASYILAPNFTSGAVEVYDSNFKSTTLPGGFTDPNLPANYAPFSVHVIAQQVFVAYALRTSTAPFRTVNGVGNGIVDVYDNTGKLQQRVATAGNLNAPWGVAFAPVNFGVFSSALLVGNFGDGHINAYDGKTFAYLGQLPDSTGKPLTYPSLWELLPGGYAVAGTTTPSGGDPSTVYFTAGLDSEMHGLFAAITNGTTTGATPTFGFTTGDAAVTSTTGTNATTSINIVPVNNFTGSVSLACSGLPAGATCSFTPATMTVSSTQPSSGSVTIQVTRATASLRPIGGLSAGIAAAMLLPFAAFLRRRGSAAQLVHGIRIFSIALMLIATTGFVAGCAGGSSTPATPISPVTPTTPVTPAGTSTVTITATSGSITQTSTVALTVK